MTIHIVTDSTCDLPEETVKSLGVTVLPRPVSRWSRYWPR